MSNGFFLGGVAEGMKTAADQQLEQEKLAQLIDFQNKGLGLQQQGLDLRKQEMGQNLSLRTRALDLQAQGQKNAQAREILARADAQVGHTMDLVNETVQHLKAAGKDPDTIAQTVQPLVQSAKSLRAKAGGGDPASLDAQLSVMLAQPTPTETAVAGVNTKVATAKAVQDATGVSQPDALAGQGLIPKPQPLELKTVTNPDFSQTAVAFNPSTGEAHPISIPQQTPAPAAPAPTTAVATGDNELPPSTNPQVQRLISSGVIDQKTLDFRATQFALGNKDSVAGYGRDRLGTMIRNGIQTRAAEISMSMNMSPGEANARKAQTAAAATTLSKLTQTKNAIESFENTAIKNGDILVQLAQKVDSTGMPVFEKWVRSGRQATGDPDVAALNAQMTLYRAEVAKILTNPNLTGVLTDDARREVAAALGNGASFAQIKAVHDLLKGDFARRSQSIDEQIDKVNKSFGPAGKGTAAPSPATPSAPAINQTSSGVRWSIVP